MIRTIKAIFLTEYRELRSVTAIFFGIGIMTFVYLLLMYYQYDNNIELCYADTVGWNLVVYAAILSGIMFVREVEQGSVEFYRRIPVDAFQIAAGKILYLTVSTFALGFVLFGLGWLGRYYCVISNGQRWGELFQMSTNQHLFRDLFRGLLFVVSFGIFWSTHCRNTIMSLILSLLSPMLFLGLLSVSKTELFLSIGLPILPTFASVLWGIVAGFAIRGVRVWPYRSWQKHVIHDPDQERNGRIHEPFMALVLLTLRQNRTTITISLAGTLILSFLLWIPGACDFFFLLGMGMVFFLTILTSQIFSGRDGKENRQIFARLGVSAKQFRWSRLALYGGIYCVLLFITGIMLCLVCVINGNLSPFSNPGSWISLFAYFCGSIYWLICGTAPAGGLCGYFNTTIVFVMFLAIPFLWGMWFSAFCRSRMISLILTGMLSLFTYGFLLYYPFFPRVNQDIFLPCVNWIPFWIILMESTRRLVNNRFNMPEGIQYRTRHFIWVTTAAILISLVVYPLGQILAIPKVQGTVVPDASLLTDQSGDTFISTDFLSLFTKVKNRVQTPNVEMIKDLENIYDLVIKSYGKNNMASTQPIWYYESQICFILYGTVDRLDGESLVRAGRLLERMATDRPSYDRQLMKLYSELCQYNKNPKRFENKRPFRGYRASFRWWRNIQYQNVLWNELQELTPVILLTQKAFLTHQGRMDSDPQYCWQYSRFSKVDPSGHYEHILNQNRRFQQYNQMFGNSTLTGYSYGNMISIAETEAFRRGLLVILAIHRYQLEQGKIPESVAALVQTGYLKEIPNGPGYNQPIGLTKKLSQPFNGSFVQNPEELTRKSRDKTIDIAPKFKQVKLHWHFADYDDPLWWNIKNFSSAQICWNYLHPGLYHGQTESNKLQMECQSASQGQNHYFLVPCVLIPTVGQSNSAVVYALPWRNRSRQ